MSKSFRWSSLYPKDYTEAVGTFALAYNALELTLYGFFQRYAPGETEAQGFLYSRLHNADRRAFIEAVAKVRETRPVSEAIIYAMRCFNICAENRNLLLHAVPFSAGEVEEGREGTLVMGKIRKDQPHQMSLYDFSTETVRAASDAVEDAEEFIRLILVGLEDAGDQPPNCRHDLLYHVSWSCLGGHKVQETTDSRPDLSG